MTTVTAKDPSSARTVARQQRARDEKVATRELLLESARTILRQWVTVRSHRHLTGQSVGSDTTDGISLLPQYREHL